MVRTVEVLMAVGQKARHDLDGDAFKGRRRGLLLGVVGGLKHRRDAHAASRRPGHLAGIQIEGLGEDPPSVAVTV